ncbi:MAG: TusE/DsrC/DsvC family sulfur relay protein [Proteobacteria bacterium]|nr:TusE/DsrC/DsvC family sulfur relay protein [Pseudomonadota bacterium]MBU1738893.1 TusE/DsrC/DsvC family sulfur relay protein [Pseudomonadota bacterium]
MNDRRHEKKTVRLDDEGYLTDQNDWDEDVALFLAGREGRAELTAEQMEIIRFMRTYYKKYNAFPMLQYVCKNINQPRECVTEQFINPGIAWKIAGLPKLDGIHFISPDGKNFRMEECC